LAIEDDLLREARKLAVDRNTTVNQLVREFLQETVRQPAARERLLNCRIPALPITWTRDELYER